jgi:tetratricopeptide (TPR) repeat protein
MKTATLTRRNNLQILEEALQGKLEEVGLTHLSLQINCSAIEETLLVVAAHPPRVKVKAETTFAALHSAILQLKPKAIEKVGLCLKVTDQKQSYAFHSFSMEQSVSSRFGQKRKDKNSSAIVPISLWRAVEESLAVKLDNSVIEEVENTETAANSSLNISDDLDDLDDLEFDIREEENSDLLENPFDAQDLKLAPKKSLNLPFTWLWLAGAGSVTALLLSFFYFLTRPCVIGNCTVIATAEQLNQESVKTLRTKKTSNGIQEATAKLNQAISQLETIPFWSPSYGESKNKLQNYRVEKQHLDSVTMAIKQGYSASVKSQNLPQSIETWTETKSLWQSAIVPLEKIPKTTPVYPFAHQKAQEYIANLALANKRLLVEQEAENKLNQAKALAQVVEVRTGIAQSVESWEKIESDWEKVVNLMKSISEGTTAYDRAKVLLKEYQTEFAKARDRKTIEEIAEDAYSRAITFAAQARIFQERKQWSQASEYWQKALSAAQEVPTTTSYYFKIRPLINSFKDHLQKVEAKLIVEKILLKAGTDLDKICNAAPKVCEFTVNDQLIVVQMTPGYVQRLQQTFIKAGNKDVKTRQAVEKHLQTLQSALETISNNAGVPLKLYDAEGKIIGTHSNF